MQACTDSLLDLILSVDDSVKNLVDYCGKDELIYLGPDEQGCGVGVLADGAAIVFPVVTCLFSFAGDPLGH